MRGWSASSRSARPVAPPVAQRMNSSTRRVERQRARLDFLAQRIPRRKSVLARDRPTARRAAPRSPAAISSRDLPDERGQDGEARERVRLARLARRRAATSLASSVVRDSDVRAARVTAYNLHASALWFADRQHGGVVAVSRAAMTVGLALRANPRAPVAHTITVALWSARVNDVAVLSTGAICDKMIR